MPSVIAIGGGGVRVNYPMGCLKKLNEMGSPLANADIVSGVSAGAIAACTLGTHGSLHANYNTLADTNIVAHRGTCGLISNALSVATGRSTAMYSSEALRNTLQGMFLPSSEVKCQQVNVWATNMHNRSKKRFSYLMGQHVDVDHILASCAIPGVFPPVQINGNMFVDGGAFNSAFPTDDIKDALHNPTINTISVYSPTPWLGHARCNTTSTIGTGVKSLVKAIGMSYMHNLQELDHWQIMDMLDIDHDDVPDGRFMALYNKNKYNNNVDLLEIVKPGIQPTAELWDMAVFFLCTHARGVPGG